MRRIRAEVLVCVAMLLATGCVSPQILTIEANVPSEVRAEPWAGLENSGASLGKTPIDVDLTTLKGQVLTVSSPDKASFYIMIPDKLASNTKLSLVMKDVPLKSADGASDPKFSLNTYSRLLMVAYRSVLDGDYATSRELADRMAAMAPGSAAPLVIKGLAYFQEGKKAEARQAFNQAKAMAPDDADVAELLQIVK